MGSHWYDMDGNDLGDRAEGAIAWGRRYPNGDARAVARDTLPDGRWVSTVLLGLDHRHNDGPPLIFETMVFRDQLHGETLHGERYETRAEAEAGHARIVAECLAGQHLPAVDPSRPVESGGGW